MSQLTVTLDDDLLHAAQAYARQHGQELDALVASAYCKPPRGRQLPRQPRQISPPVPTNSCCKVYRHVFSGSTVRLGHLLILIIKRNWKMAGCPVIGAALQLGFNGFEDGLQYCAARTVPVFAAIVTRDPRSFAAGARPVLSPPEALAQLA